jgi:hypothetical protein
MAARSFLSNFFGGNKSLAPSEEEKHNQTPVSTPTNTSTPNHTGGKDFGTLLIREEIIDTRNRLCGYRFLSKSITGCKPVSEALFFETLCDADIAEFAQRRRTVITISPDGVVFGHHRLLAAPNALRPLWVLQPKRWSQPGRLHLHGRRTFLAAAVHGCVDGCTSLAIGKLIIRKKNTEGKRCLGWTADIGEESEREY